MVPVRINDPQDPRVAAYLDIRERDLAGRHGRFVAEGKVVLDILLSAKRFTVESVLVLENRLAGLYETLRHAPADLPVYVAAGEIMDRIAGFHMHRGILAIGSKGTPTRIEALLSTLPASALVIVLVGIANHDNMGSIFRNAAALAPMPCFWTRPAAIRCIARPSASRSARAESSFASFSDPAGFIATLDRLGFSQIRPVASRPDRPSQCEENGATGALPRYRR
jgi:hypothetical protein